MWQIRAVPRWLEGSLPETLSSLSRSMGFFNGVLGFVMAVWAVCGLDGGFGCCGSCGGFGGVKQVVGLDVVGQVVAMWVRW